jgi:hypothetical protein
VNYSIYSSDRTTHLKIVVVALVAGIGVASFGIATRFKSDDRSPQIAHAFKAGKASMKFAAALPARQETSSDVTFLNGSSALSDSRIK